MTDAASLAYNDGEPYVLDDEGYSVVGMRVCGRCAEQVTEIGYTVAPIAQ